MVALQMYGEQAIHASILYLSGCYKCVILCVAILASNHGTPALGLQLGQVLAAMGSFFYSSAVQMLILESELLDLLNLDGDIPFSKLLEGITLDSYENDNECESKTWFWKAHL